MISCASSVYLWLHIQSAINMVVIAWILCSGHIEINLKMDLTLVGVASVAVWRVLSHSHTPSFFYCNVKTKVISHMYCAFRSSLRTISMVNITEV
jgi:hypothetical protein